MFQIFEIREKRFEYSNIIWSPKFSNPNPNIQDSRKKIRIRIESEYIRSSLVSKFQVDSQCLSAVDAMYSDVKLN